LIKRSITEGGISDLVTPIVINYVGFTVLIVLLSVIYRRLRDNTTLRVDAPER